MDNIKYEVVDDTTFKFKPASSVLPNPPKTTSSYVPPTTPSVFPTQSTIPVTSATPTTISNSTSNSNPLNMNMNSFNFDEKVKDYVRKNRPRIYILTPCYGSMCHLNYVTCLIHTMNALKELGVEVMVEFCKNDSLVSRARNNLVAKAMNDPKMTHIMFIDSDITWEPSAILKLLISNKHIVGGVYPLKHYSWERLVSDPANPYNSNIVQSWIKSKENSQLKGIVKNEDLIKHKLLSYNINFLDNYLKIDDNLAKVKHTATGFMMIQRYTIETMMKAFPSTKYTDDVRFLKPEENRFAYALFDCGVEDDHYYSEDWLFCHRWQKMGGDIYIDVSINLIHSGMEDYNGSFIASIVN
jgi:Anp1